MPNWVFNSVVISGNPTDLAALKEKVGAPFETYFSQSVYNDETKTWDEVPNKQSYSNPVFSFWNVVRPEDSESYFKPKVYAPAKEGEDLMTKIVNEIATGMDWYNWNVRNWGTKWDVAVQDDEKWVETALEETDGELCYRFDTAWSPVFQIFDALSEMFPELLFDYEYEEEQGWGGHAVWAKGEMITHTEYDIPNSHADYIERDRDCPCAWESDYAPAWFADCPIDTSKYELVDGEWVEKEGAEA